MSTFWLRQSRVNQLTASCIDADHSGACDGSETAVSYSYDAYGNLTDDGASTYTYDAANRLFEVSDEWM